MCIFVIYPDKQPLSEYIRADTFTKETLSSNSLNLMFLYKNTQKLNDNQSYLIGIIFTIK